MEKFLVAVVWLIMFVTVCTTLSVAALGLVIEHGYHMPHRLLRALIVAGGGIGVLAFYVLAKRRLLPGLRPPRPLVWGVWQAVWLITGFILMQGVGAVGCNFAISFIVNFPRAFPLLNNTAVAAVLAGYLTSALWCVWFVRRRGPALLADGSPQGVAWRPASRANYLTAALLAGIITVIIVVMFQIVPPNQAALQSLPIVQTFGHPGWPVAFLLVLAVFIAPPVEEFVFRGGIFAGLARRCGPLWAGIITTILFMAVHAPEKLHYPLGFIDVGMMAAAAAWLRVRAGSIRPGILLHMLYNIGAVVAAGLAH